MTSSTIDATRGGEAAHDQESPSGLCGVSGPLLAWIRKKAGWSREAFCRKIRWTRVDEKEAGSSRQYQTYEGQVEASPVVVQRYRRIIGDTLFDELWQKAKQLFGNRPPARKTSPRTTRGQRRNAIAHGL